MIAASRLLEQCPDDAEERLLSLLPSLLQRHEPTLSKTTTITVPNVFEGDLSALPVDRDPAFPALPGPSERERELRREPVVGRSDAGALLVRTLSMLQASHERYRSSLLRWTVVESVHSLTGSPVEQASLPSSATGPALPGTKVLWPRLSALRKERQVRSLPDTVSTTTLLVDVNSFAYVPVILAHVRDMVERSADVVAESVASAVAGRVVRAAAATRLRGGGRVCLILDGTNTPVEKGRNVVDTSTRGDSLRAEQASELNSALRLVFRGWNLATKGARRRATRALRRYLIGRRDVFMDSCLAKCEEALVAQGHVVEVVQASGEADVAARMMGPQLVTSGVSFGVAAADFDLLFSDLCHCKAWAWYDSSGELRLLRDVNHLLRDSLGQSSTLVSPSDAGTMMAVVHELTGSDISPRVNGLGAATLLKKIGPKLAESVADVRQQLRSKSANTAPAVPAPFAHAVVSLLSTSQLTEDPTVVQAWYDAIAVNVDGVGATTTQPKVSPVRKKLPKDLYIHLFGDFLEQTKDNGDLRRPKLRGWTEARRGGSHPVARRNPPQGQQVGQTLVTVSRFWVLHSLDKATKDSVKPIRQPGRFAYEPPMVGKARLDKAAAEQKSLPALSPIADQVRPCLPHQATVVAGNALSIPLPDGFILPDDVVARLVPRSSPGPLSLPVAMSVDNGSLVSAPLEGAGGYALRLLAKGPRQRRHVDVTASAGSLDLWMVKVTPGPPRVAKAGHILAPPVKLEGEERPKQRMTRGSWLLVSAAAWDHWGNDIPLPALLAALSPSRALAFDSDGGKLKVSVADDAPFGPAWIVAGGVTLGGVDVVEDGTTIESKMTLGRTDARDCMLRGRHPVKTLTMSLTKGVGKENTALLHAVQTFVVRATADADAMRLPLAVQFADASLNVDSPLTASSVPRLPSSTANSVWRTSTKYAGQLLREMSGNVATNTGRALREIVERCVYDATIAELAVPEDDRAKSDWSFARLAKYAALVCSTIFGKTTGQSLLAEEEKEDEEKEGEKEGEDELTPLAKDALHSHPRKDELRRLLKRPTEKLASRMDEALHLSQHQRILPKLSVSEAGKWEWASKVTPAQVWHLVAAANRKEGRLRYALFPRPSGKREARSVPITQAAYPTLSKLVSGGKRKRGDTWECNFHSLFPGASQHLAFLASRGQSLAPTGFVRTDGVQLSIAVYDLSVTFKSKATSVAATRRREEARPFDSRSWRGVQGEAGKHRLEALLDAKFTGVCSVKGLVEAGQPVLQASVLNKCIVVGIDPGRTEVATFFAGIPHFDAKNRFVGIEGVKDRVADATLHALKETEAHYIGRRQHASTLVTLDDDKARCSDAAVRRAALASAAARGADLPSDKARAMQVEKDANLRKQRAVEKVRMLLSRNVDGDVSVAGEPAPADVALDGNAPADAPLPLDAAATALRLAELAELDARRLLSTKPDDVDAHVSAKVAAADLSKAAADVIGSLPSAPESPSRTHGEQRAARFRGRQRAEAALLNAIVGAVGVVRHELSDAGQVARPHTIVFCGAGGFSGKATKFAHAGWTAFQLAKILGRRFLTVMTNEFLTSQSCPACESKLKDAHKVGAWRYRLCPDSECPFAARAMSKDVTASLCILRAAIEHLLTGKRPVQFTANASWWRRPAG